MLIFQEKNQHFCYGTKADPQDSAMQLAQRFLYRKRCAHIAKNREPDLAIIPKFSKL
jgi:hypothetical protein